MSKEDSRTHQVYQSQFKKYNNLCYNAVQLSMQNRATKGLMWCFNEQCYFDETQLGKQKAISKNNCSTLSSKRSRFPRQWGLRHITQVYHTLVDFGVPRPSMASGDVFVCTKRKQVEVPLLNKKHREYKETREDFQYAIRSWIIRLLLPLSIHWIQAWMSLKHRLILLRRPYYQSVLPQIILSQISTKWCINWLVKVFSTPKLKNNHGLTKPIAIDSDEPLLKYYLKSEISIWSVDI